MITINTINNTYHNKCTHNMTKLSININSMIVITTSTNTHNIDTHINSTISTHIINTTY